MRRVFEQRRSEFWLALVTALTVVFVGVEQGILLAIALSLVDHTRHGYRPKNAVLVPDESDSWSRSLFLRADNFSPTGRSNRPSAKETDRIAIFPSCPTAARTPRCYLVGLCNSKH